MEEIQNPLEEKKLELQPIMVSKLMRGSVRKLENDIAKIRKELGDGRMREIIDGK